MSKKKQTDLFGDDELQAQRPANDFDRLLENSLVSTRGLATGDRFRGEILAVHGSEAFIATGTPTDATMPFALSGDQEKPKVGDVLEVIVVRAREGEILVRPASGRGGQAEVDNLEDAFDMELPVEGLVLEAVKGGFRVKIQDHKAFCPISQMDWRCPNPNDYVGRRYEFMITKMERGRDLVVSRRKILQQERVANEGEFLASAEVGDIFTATVVRIEKYGAFVRLANGIEGLVPIAELSWGRIGHPQEVVSLNQSVQVKLLSTVEEDERLKVSFSLKQGGAVADPWSEIESNFPVGTQVEGTVEHKEHFGLFVNLALGVTGLLPRSAWRDSTESSQYEGKRRGDRVKVRVERIDLDHHKISLSLPHDDEEGENWREHAAKSSKTQGLGTLGDLLKGVKLKN